MSYPNNITILINTRVRGYPKIKYEPSMSIPGIKSNAVFFDPLIKLNSRVVSGSEQFLIKGEFDSLLNRTISSSYLGQRRVDYDTAEKNGYIDNNIKVTLDQLFKPNNHFYIKGQPFTIHEYEWNVGDWRIDTKSFEKDFQNYNYKNGFNTLVRYNLTKSEEEQAEKELVEFKKKHPDSFKGKISEKNSQLASYFEGNSEESGVAMGLAANEEPTNSIIKEPMPMSVIKDYKKIEEKLPTSAKKLIASQLVLDDPIFSDSKIPNLQSDPITQSLIYPNDRNYSVEQKKSPELKKRYDNFLIKRDELDRINKKYNEELGLDINENEVQDPSKKSLLNLKKDYDTYSVSMYKKIQENVRNNSDKARLLNDTRLKPIIMDSLNRFVIIKKNYLKKNAEVLYLFGQKIVAQNQYIRAFIDFYTQLSNVKEHERLILNANANEKSSASYPIHEKFILDFAIQCIQFDVGVYKSALNNTEEYTTQIEQKIQNKIERLKAYVEKNYNVNEEFDRFFENPDLLKIDQYQYDVYYQYILLYSQQNDAILWKQISSKTVDFFETIKTSVMKNLEETFMLLQKYNDTYNSAERSAFLQKMEIGDTSVQNQSMVQYLSYNKDHDKYKLQKQNFLELKNAEIMSYEWITIYSRVLAIQLARKISYLTVKDNMNNINRNIYSTMTRYYTLIQNNIPKINGLLSPSLYWSTDKYDDNDIVEKNIVMNDKNEKNNAVQLLYIEQKMSQLEEEYKKAIDLLIPYISEMGVMKTCYQLTDSDAYLKKNPMVNTNKYLTIQFIHDFKINEDVDLTNVLKSQLMLLILEQIQDGSAEEINIDEIADKISGWKTSSPLLGAEKDSFFSSIVTAFNGELTIKQNLTLNKYARRPNNEKDELPLEDVSQFKFTVQQLRNAVADNITQYDFLNYSNTAKQMVTDELIYFNNLMYVPDEYKVQLKKKIYKKWEKIGFMFIYSFEDTLERIKTHKLKNRTYDYNVLFSELILNANKSFESLKNIIRQPFSIKNKNKEGKMYYGDKTALNIIEKVFKIKIFVVDVYQEPLDYKTYVGKSVVFRSQTDNMHPEQETRGYIKSHTIENFTKNYLNKLNEVNEEANNLKLNYQLYCLNKIKSILNNKRNNIENNPPEEDIDNIHEILIRLIEDINNIIDSLSMQNISLPYVYTYFFTNLFLMDPDGIPNDEMVLFLQTDHQANISHYFSIHPLDLEQRLSIREILVFLMDTFTELKRHNIIYLPQYVVETERNVQYEIQSNRMIELTKPFFNISLDSSSFNKTDNKTLGYLFLLKDKNDDSEIVYKNILNFSNKIFLYKFDEIPNYLSYLYFRSFRKFSDVKIKANTFKDFAFKDLFDTYKQNYMNKIRDVEVIQLEPIDSMSKLNKLNRTASSMRGGVFMPNGVEIGGGGGGGVFMPNGVEIGGGGGIGGKSTLNQSYSNVKNNNLFGSKESKLSFYVIINLDLYPGKDKITTGRKLVMGCQNRYEKIRQAWAKLFNLVYLPSESYSLQPNKNHSKKKEKKNKYSSQVTNNYINNNYYPSSSETRKNGNNGQNTKTRRNN